MQNHETEIRTTVARLVHLAKERSKSKDVPFYTLLKQTGYFDECGRISEQLIRDELSRHPELLDDWMRYSEDKRTTTGWYLVRRNPDLYVVGYHGDPKRTADAEYADSFEACAAFIKQEIEETRTR